jgi:hypothetical protein
MEQKIRLKYYNKQLNIGVVTWREMHLLDSKPVQLFPEVNKGKLMFRAMGSSRRFSYHQIRKGLSPTTICISIEVQLLSF